MQYTTADGLPSNVIYGIMEDAYARLWISTNQGLSCLNPENGKFRNFTILDGLREISLMPDLIVVKITVTVVRGCQRHYIIPSGNTD